MPHGVGGVGDSARSLAEVPQQGIASAQAESLSDIVLVLSAQDVGGTSILRQGAIVQGVTYVKQQVPDVGKSLAWHVRHPGCRDGIKDAGVAQTAVGLLEVGFEEVGRFSVTCAPLDHGFANLAQTRPGKRAPVGQDGARYLLTERDLSRDGSRIEQAQDDADVPRGCATHLGRCAHAVIDPHAGVPHRVPQPVDHRRDAGVPRVHAVGDDEQQVEVAARGQGAAPVSAHGNEASAEITRPAGGEDLGEPGVRERRQREAPRRTGRHGTAEQLAARLAVRRRVGGGGRGPSRGR